MKQLRDTQRSKVYKSERQAFENGAKLSPPSLPNIDDAVDYAHKVLTSKRVQAAFPKISDKGELIVGDGRGCRRAFYTRDQWEITLPKWARREWVIIHEIAHGITEAHAEGAYAAHGWQFAETYLKLVLYLLGREAHDKLKASFKQHRVKFSAPRAKRILTPEQKAQLASRLEAARNAKNNQQLAA